MGDASLSESPEEEEDNDSPGPHRGNSNSQNTPEELVPPSADDFHGSPRKRTQTLPVFNCPLTGMAAKADALNRWSRIQETIEEKSGTLSEDIFKILDLRSSGSFFGGSQTNKKEGENRATARRGSDTTGSAPAGTVKPERVTTGSAPAGTVKQERVTTGSAPAGTVKPESDTRPVLTHQKKIHTLTLSTDQEISSGSEQKKESQQLPQSLQQENKELKATVAELQSALEAERRRVAALEICLRNAERSRDEALRRNDELQRDIQQFLTKGSLAPT